jgi:hypothetical protein
MSSPVNVLPQGTVLAGVGGGSAPIQVTPTTLGTVLKYDPTQTAGCAWEPALQFQTTTYPTGSYSVKTTDQLVYASSSAAHTITLPAGMGEGFSVYVKDVTGNAATFTITVTAAVNIDGASSYTITTNYGHARFVYSATNTLWYTS